MPKHNHYMFIAEKNFRMILKKYDIEQKYYFRFPHSLLRS